jgi:eukaryotic-like serine/threonine-protein kinase
VTAKPASAPPRSAERTVKVAILPAGAAVEVEGAKAAVEGGSITITGPLGSVHRVKLSDGALETSDEVVVTEGGALPPRLELKRERRAGARR